jgi:hypothetical protein
MRLALLAACLAAAGCKKAPPPQPRFCDQDLSGVWLNSSDRHFAYRFRDHGGVVSGEFLQRADDGGMTAPSPPITFEMRRSPDAIAGVMRGSDTTQGGHACATEFETRVTDCKPDALQVVSETTAPIGEDCKRLTAADGGALPLDLTEFRFERAP